jgi:urease accessory protein
MLRVERHADPKSVPSDTLRLAYDDRKKSRLRVWSEQRREVGIFLAWGTALREGDLLAANSGEVLVVRAAAEPLSEVRTRDWHLLTRAAYHLGNRHVALQIEPGILRYQRDHVLDEMVQQLGLVVEAVEAPFEPEGGAYAGGVAHAHAHENDYVHADDDVHEQREHEHPHAHRSSARELVPVYGHSHHAHEAERAGPRASTPGDSESNLEDLLHRLRNP